MTLHDKFLHRVIPTGDTLQEKSLFIIDYVCDLHQFHRTMEGNTGEPSRFGVCLARKFSMSYRCMECGTNIDRVERKPSVKVT